MQPFGSPKRHAGGAAYRLFASSGSAGARRLVVVALLAAVVLVVLSTTAFAGKFTDRFYGSSGDADGQLTDPRGIAVNVSGNGAAEPGDIYVVEDTNARVQVFDSAGNFKRMWGKGVLDTTNAAQICTAADAPCTDASTEEGTAAGMFNDPAGIAINETGAGPGDPGDVYVRDADNQRVQQFDAEGNFIRMWGWGVDTGADQFEVCEAADLPCGEGQPVDRTKVGGFANTGDLGASGGSAQSTGIAVDQATGEVWVVDQFNQRFQRYAGDGDSVPPEAHGRTADDLFESAAADDAFSGTGATAPQHIAIDGEGIVYVGDAGSNSAKIVRYDPDAGQFLRRLGGNTAASGGLGQDGALSGLAIDADTDNLLVARRGQVAVQEFDLAGVGPDEDLAVEDLVDSHGVGFGEHLDIRGVAVNPSSGEIFLTSFDDDSVAVLDDDGANPLPLVQVQPPAGVTSTTATLKASIDPVLAADFPTRYRFELSKDGVSWTEVAPVSDPDLLVGGDGFTADTAIEKLATGLEANTLYLVRVVTTRDPAAGTAFSAEVLFKTDPAPPDTITDGASAVTSSGAQLNGRVNPGGLDTRYWFEWGDDSYGNTTPVPAGNLPAGPTLRAVGEPIAGLEPSSVYHFRLCAQNSLVAAPVCGIDRIFTTLDASATPAGRAYEMITSPDKPLRQGNGGRGPSDILDFARNNGGLPTPDGAAVRWRLFPAATSPDAGHSFTWVRTPEDYTRTPTGWKAETLTNVVPPSGGAGASLELAGTSANLKVSAWFTQTPIFDNFPALGTGTGSNQALRVKGDTGGPRNAGWYPWVDPAWYDTTGGAVVDATNWKTLIDDQGERLIGSTAQPGNSSSRLLLEITPADGGNAPRDLDPPQQSGKALFLSSPEVGWRPGDLVNECTGTGTAATLIPSRDDNGTDAGPSGGPGNVAGMSWSVGATVLTGIAFVTTLTGTLPGHYVTSTTPGVFAPDTRVVSVNFDTAAVTIDKPALLAGSFATIGIGQRTAALADDIVATRACEEGSPTDVRGAVLSGSGPLDGSQITAMSDSGNRVFFMSPDPVVAGTACAQTTGANTACPPQLFVRSYDGSGNANVRWISRAEDALFDGSPGQRPDAMGNGVAFEGASRDGSVAYFRTNAPLLEDDPNGGVDPATAASPISWDLYRYELGDDVDPAPAGADPAGRLTRVTAGPVSVAPPADPNTSCTGAGASCGGSANGAGGVVRFMSDDGDRAYIVTAARIPGATNSPAENGTTEPTAETDRANVATRNLYLYDADKSGAAAYKFVARIPFAAGGGNADSCASYSSQAGGRDLGSNETTNGLAQRTGISCVHGTTSGDAIAFRTKGQLTADDVDTAADIYLYEAAEDRLTRVSAPPAGTTPYACQRDTPSSPVLAYCNADFGVSSDQVALVTEEFGQVGLRHWGMAENSDGSLKALYFESRLPLAPEDVNGAGAVDYSGGEGLMDVYEWRDGKVRLISPGDSQNSAFYSGNSLDGSRVFFWTEQRISPWEIDPSDGDLYTASVGGGLPGPVAPPPVCAVLAGGCHAGDVGMVPVDPETSRPAGNDNADAGARKTLSVAALGSKAKRRAARTGRLKLRVRTDGTGKLSVVARGTIGKRKRALAKGSKAVRRPGVVSVSLRLNRQARKVLRTGRPLKLAIEVRQAGARTRTMTVRLRRPAS